MVELKNISLRFAGQRTNVLNDISWHIRANENWVLFGRNGSGKTKLLEIITGYLFPSEGEVIRFGSGQSGSDIREVRKRIGYISTALKDAFSKNERIIDIVLSGLFASIGLYQEPREGDRAAARELLAALGLEERSSERFGTLSDGERQMVLILRAFINSPDLLIFDEPAVSLDLSAREQLLESIEILRARKEISLIYVTHHIEEITPLFNKIYIIDEGRCCFNGLIASGLSDSLLSRIFNRKIQVRRFDGRYYALLDSEQ
jgi:iron complex transport system ATP-binding protein